MIGVSINYRVSAFGFLAGSDALEAGIANNGFRDQRLALQWINENVASFGGDPTKVTIWGESSGAESVSAQVLAYNGGFPLPRGYLSSRPGCESTCFADGPFRAQVVMTGSSGLPSASLASGVSCPGSRAVLTTPRPWMRSTTCSCPTPLARLRRTLRLPSTACGHCPLRTSTLR